MTPRTLTYYTPEDVAEMKRQVDTLRVHLAAAADTIKAQAARIERLIEENAALAESPDDRL